MARLCWAMLVSVTGVSDDMARACQNLELQLMSSMGMSGDTTEMC